jgi:hypothetical protein
MGHPFITVWLHSFYGRDAASKQMAAVDAKILRGDQAGSDEAAEREVNLVRFLPMAPNMPERIENSK